MCVRVRVREKEREFIRARPRGIDFSTYFSMTRKERHSTFTTFVCPCPISSLVLSSFRDAVTRRSPLRFIVRGRCVTYFAREFSARALSIVSKAGVKQGDTSAQSSRTRPLLAEDTRMESYKTLDAIFIISIESLRCDFSFCCAGFYQCHHFYSRDYFSALLFSCNQHAEINIEKSSDPSFIL